LLAGLLVPGLAIKFTRCELQNQVVASPEGCKICVEFADKALNTLLNLILGRWAWLQIIALIGEFNFRWCGGGWVWRSVWGISSKNQQDNWRNL